MRRLDFSVAQLMLVLVVLVPYGAIFIPSLCSARAKANDNQARLMLTSLFQREEEFKNQVELDTDADQIGEFGSPTQLKSLFRSDTTNVFPDWRSLVETEKSGIYRYRDHLYRVHVNEDGESGWACYAWPITSVSGTVALYIDESGELKEFINDGSVKGIVYDRETGPPDGAVSAGGWSRRSPTRTN